MCGSHYSIRGHYPYAHYGNIHLQLNTFISPFQHKFVEKPGLEPGMVHVLILRSIALTLPLFQRLPIPPLLHVCPPYLHRPCGQVNKVIPYKPLKTLSE